MGKVSNEFLNRIKAAVNLIDVVVEHVVLRKSGSNHTGLCPFHSERSPSFSVSEGKQLFHCYGCKAGGDLFKFVMEIHGISFPEAVEELATRGKIQLPKEFHTGSGARGEARLEQEEKSALLYKLNRYVAGFYHQQLTKTPHAVQYVRRRGISSELERSFYVGYASASWEDLSHFLENKKAPLPLAMQLGLIRESTKNQSGHFDLFRNRVLFPILDTRGRVVGFGGRTIADPPDDPKYLNSPESPVFQKSKILFGLYQAQKHIREKDEVVVVEGYFDAIALHAAGFEHAVATCGTALTPEHLTILGRFASKITLLFDGDRAGMAALDRSMEIGLKQGVILRSCQIPEGMDPDEILFDQETGAIKSEGAAQMKKMLDEASPLLDQRLEAAALYAEKNVEARAEALKQVGRWIAMYQDPVGKEIRREWVEKRFQVSRPLLQKAIDSGPGAQSSSVHQNKAKPPKTVQNTRPMELKLGALDRVLLTSLLLMGREVFLTQVGARLPPEAHWLDLFESLELRDWLLKNDIELKEGLDQMRQEPHLTQLSTWLMSLLVSEQVPARDNDQKNSIERGIARVWARFSQKIKQALHEAEAKKDAGLQARLMKEYLDVQRKMKEFSALYDEIPQG